MIYEEVPDSRGEKTPTLLGQAQWTRTSASAHDTLALQFTKYPQTEYLFLKIDNGDNPPLKLSNFSLTYQTRQILFKTNPGSELYLYYGNSAASAPSYEIDLLQQQLLQAKPSEAILESAKDILKVDPWYQFSFQSKTMKYLFWGIMALVVLVLLGVIAKLLPGDDIK